jgi:DNA-binding transcriptional regulator LsrR (DeoR family)
VVGIGQIGAQAHMYETGMVTPEEFAEVERAGAVGEVLGQFVDADGRSVNAPVNQRSIAVSIDDLRGKEVVVIAGGHGKARAIDAVLATGVVTGLITDEATAQQLIPLAARRGRASASINPLATS